MSYVLPVFKELDACLLKIIVRFSCPLAAKHNTRTSYTHKLYLPFKQNWIILVTPFAVFSLIAAAVGGQADLGNTFENVAYLVLACCFGFAMQFLIVHGLIFGLVTKSNPLGYFKYIVPAQTMAFACASSAATIPVTLRSVRSTGRVPESIIKFVVPLGATINMDGSAIYFPCACIWLAVLNGVQINAAHYM
jgi:Na+/H+-dicarboxylate symporter